MVATLSAQERPVAGEIVDVRVTVPENVGAYFTTIVVCPAELAGIVTLVGLDVIVNAVPTV